MCPALVWSPLTFLRVIFMLSAEKGTEAERGIEEIKQGFPPQS